MQNVSKRTILWIVPIAIIAIFWYYYGPKEEITDNEYITYVKESTINNSNNSLNEALTDVCIESRWVYFKTQKNQNVVEFKGTCEINKQENDVNLQFVVEEEKKAYEIGVLLLNGKQQTEEKRDEMLEQIASN